MAFDSIRSVADAVIRGLPGGDAAAAPNYQTLFLWAVVTDDKSLANYLAEANGGNPTRKISWICGVKRMQL